MSKKNKKHHIQELKKYELTDDELFNGYQTFAKILYINLKKLKRNYKDIPTPLYVKDDGIMPIDYAQKKWNKILDKMIWSFNEYANEYPNKPYILPNEDGYSKSMEKYTKKLHRGLKLFYKWFEWLFYY